MMQRSTGGEQIDLQPFEGLVLTTARMFAAQVKREEEDLAQELRVRVWRAIISHDPTRSRLSLERYVFSAITNKIKDYKRDAARETRRREDNGLSFLHIEDMSLAHHSDTSQQELFERYYHFVDRDSVYGQIEDGPFRLPATVTALEADVLVLLMMELGRAEIALRLSVMREEVEVAVRGLREKFADWRPESDSAPVEVTRAPLELAAARAA